MLLDYPLHPIVHPGQVVTSDADDPCDSVLQLFLDGRVVRILNMLLHLHSYHYVAGCNHDSYYCNLELQHIMCNNDQDHA